MDRVKASPKMLGKYSALTKEEYIAAKGMAESRGQIADSTVDIGQNKLDSNKKFWWSLGLDQGVHHLTHYIIIAFL